jgi:hypothetical protein
MSADSKDQKGFLGRWSRMKTEAREAPATPAPAERPPVTADADETPPQLPPVDQLTLDSDFSGFFHPKVDEDMRRAALRKLFSDPHFNVMDGLDVYIDDYSKSEPIPAAMLASLKQAQRILDWAKGKEDEPEGAVAASEQPANDEALAASISAPEVEDPPSSQTVDEATDRPELLAASKPEAS